MKTTLFNLHEIQLEDHDLIIEFYAGDIFDIYTDVLILSAFRSGFNPVPGTTWGSLKTRTGIVFNPMKPEVQTRMIKNLVSFSIPKNNFFRRLFALEMVEIPKKNHFTLATLKARYRELAALLEEFPGEEDESASLPLLGTGNQQISLEDSITELLQTLIRLRKTKLKIIRIFANDIEAVGALNLKINTLLNRPQPGNSQLLDAAFEEINALRSADLTQVSRDILDIMGSLSKAENLSLNPFGISGRHFAEHIARHLLSLFPVTEFPDNLNGKIQQLTPHLLAGQRAYVISYLRLLQNYGNQVAHYGNPDLNHQDVAAIIIAVVRIVDFYEGKLKSTNHTTAS